MTRVLFVSRAYPPEAGGIERQNHEIAEALSGKVVLTRIINKWGRRFLFLFLPVATLSALARARKHDAVLLGDGVLAVTGWIVKIMTGKPVLCIVHGLDVTYSNPLYQAFWVRFALRRLDKLIAVGNETIRQGALRGIPSSKFEFVPNGVNERIAIDLDTKRAYRRQLIEHFDLNADDLIVLTLGRLVRRKGVAWFIENVAAALPGNYTYLIAGDGEDLETVRRAVDAHGPGGSVRLLGRVSEGLKPVLMGGADLFIQPNIPVENDMEGFGLVVLEAAAHGTMVVASRMEGLKDAIRENENGMLVDPGDAEAWREVMKRLIADRGQTEAMGRAGQGYVMAHCTWSQVADRYRDVITTAAAGQ